MCTGKPLTVHRTCRLLVNKNIDGLRAPPLIVVLTDTPNRYTKPIETSARSFDVLLSTAVENTLMGGAGL